MDWMKIGLWVLGLGGLVHLVKGVPFLDSLFGSMVDSLTSISLGGVITVAGIVGVISLIAVWKALRSRR